MIHLEETESGLVITLTGRDELLESIARNSRNDIAVLSDAMETAGYIGNDWYAFSADEIGCLSEAPCVGSGALYDETDTKGYPIDYEDVWFYADYQIRSWYSDLLESGSVTFSKVS